MVAPDPKGDRLKERAERCKVAILSADQLAELCRRHARAPLSLVDYKNIFVEGGEVDLKLIVQGMEHFGLLKALITELPDLLFEKTDQYGPMTSRDVHLARSANLASERVKGFFCLLTKDGLRPLYRPRKRKVKAACNPWLSIAIRVVRPPSFIRFYRSNASHWLVSQCPRGAPGVPRFLRLAHAGSLNRG